MAEYGVAPLSLGVWNPVWDEYMTYQYLPVYIQKDTPTAPGQISGNFAIPANLKFAEELVISLWDKEMLRGNHWKYIYVTAKRGFATPGNPLNRPGWHADGFGTPDINYVWTDKFPTLFAIGEFLNISEDHIKSAEQFEKQVYNFSRRVKDPIKIVTYQDKELLRLDPYVVHAAPEIPAPGGERSFFKVSFSNDRYNLRGNAHNYLLDYDWEMFDRNEIRNDPARAGRDSA